MNRMNSLFSTTWLIGFSLYIKSNLRLHNAIIESTKL